MPAGFSPYFKCLKSQSARQLVTYVSHYCVLLQAAGTKGERYSMKNTRIMMTQPMGGSQGDIYAIAATVKELNAIYQVNLPTIGVDSRGFVSAGVDCTVGYASLQQGPWLRYGLGRVGGGGEI
jgi:hypothetical protein